MSYKEDKNVQWLRYDKTIKRFIDMFDDGKIKAIENMSWPFPCLPEAYVHARKNGYWLNVEKIFHPEKVTSGAKIRLVKFSTLNKPDLRKKDLDVYDFLNERLYKIREEE